MKTLILTAGLALNLVAAAPDPSSRAARAHDEVEHLSEWPSLDSDAEASVKIDVARIRKARTEEMSEGGRAGLIEVGAGAAPALLFALGKEKEESARGRILAVLDAITSAAHTRLLAREFAHKSSNVRIFCLRRAASFPDDGTREAAQRALETARTPGRRKTVDPNEVFAASLAAAAAGSDDGLDALLERAVDAWHGEGAAIRTAVRGIEGDAATAKLLPRLQSADRRQVVAALRVLSGCGTERALGELRVLLDSDDTGIRIATINALRSIIDDDPPLEQLSAFDAIEMAKEWKARI